MAALCLSILSLVWLALSRLACIFLFIAASVAFSLPAASQVPRGVDLDDLVATLERLSLNIPMNVYGRDPIRRHLGELARESCDQQAIADLGKALENAGYRREAVTALVSFSKSCGGHTRSLRTAANILLTLSDYETTVTIASKHLVKDGAGVALRLPSGRRPNAASVTGFAVEGEREQDLIGPDARHGSLVDRLCKDSRPLTDGQGSQ
jgi:hypothetical protein